MSGPGLTLPDSVQSLLSRFETAITAAIVVAIAVSALVTDPVRQTVSLCVPSAEALARPGRHEALRGQLARALGKSTRLHLRDGPAHDRCDFIVMSVHEWRRLSRGQRFAPVAEVEGARGAVVITGPEGAGKLSVVDPGSTLFTAPHSLNGCWVQLSVMRAAGAVMPDRVDALRFAPAPGRPERVVFEVALGHAPAGAVPGGVLEEMLAAGQVVEGEVQVVAVSPGVPEVLLCVGAGEGPPPDRLIREGLRPVSRADLERVESLFAMAASMGWE